MSTLLTLNMAAITVKEKIKPVKVAFYVIGGVAAAYGIKLMFDFFGKDRNRENIENKTITDELKEAEKINAPSYPKSQYSQWAAAIAQAIYGAGTDETTIYSIFRSLKNNTDFLSLQKAWGNPNRNVYPEWYVLYPVKRSLNLSAALRYDLDSEEIKKVNLILKNRNIKYRI